MGQKMILDEAKKIFNRYSETNNYIPDYENDLAVVIDGYIFVIQAANGFNNVIFARIRTPEKTLLNVFETFKNFCLMNGIEFIRVEGTLYRYNFLSAMFPNSSFIKDYESPDRNIYYIKLRGKEK